MNYLELCQLVLDEGDISTQIIQTTRIGPDEDEQIAKITRWVKRAYREIQQWNRHFTFHHADGVFFETLDDGTTDYTITGGYRNIIRDSVSARVKATPTDDWELNYISYQDWRDKFLTVELADGRPIWFIELPNRQIRLAPGPEQVYEILCDRYTTFDKMELDEDVPIWESDDHEIVAWVALQYYINEYEVPENLTERVRQALRWERKEFLQKYLPDFQIGAYFA